jgi:hypothetical protein
VRRNRYLTFIAIGFELIAIILLSIYGGEYLVAQQGFPQYTKALLVVAGFIVWFISLVVKLKGAEKGD